MGVVGGVVGSVEMNLSMYIDAPIHVCAGVHTPVRTYIAAGEARGGRVRPEVDCQAQVDRHQPSLAGRAPTVVVVVVSVLEIFFCFCLPNVNETHQSKKLSGRMSAWRTPSASRPRTQASISPGYMSKFRDRSVSLVVTVVVERLGHASAGADTTKRTYA